MAVDAIGLNIAGQRRRDFVAAPAATAKAADADAHITIGRIAQPDANPARNVEPTIAAAATDRLDIGAIAFVARRLDVALDRGEHRLAVAAVAAKAADTDPEIAVRALRCAEPGGHVEPAVAAAAAKRLDQQCARPVTARDQVAAHVGARDRRVAAAAAETADPDPDIARQALGKAHASSDVEPAVAAAAAKRLDDNSGRIIFAGRHCRKRVRRVGRALVEVEPHVAGIAAVAAEAADPDTQRARILGDRQRPADVEAAIAAAAADRLDEQAGRRFAAGRNAAGDVGGRLARKRTRSAHAANADIGSAGPGAA